MQVVQDSKKVREIGALQLESEDVEQQHLDLDLNLLRFVMMAVFQALDNLLLRFETHLPLDCVSRDHTVPSA